jgi:hypothetical protein
MSDDTPALLRSAAQHMRERGKATGTYWDNGGSVCMAGAVSLAASDEQTADPFTLSPLHTAKFYATMQILGEHLPDRCSEHYTSGAEIGGPGNTSERVFHHSDHHCDGGEDAARVLEEVAEKIEANR